MASEQKDKSEDTKACPTEKLDGMIKFLDRACQKISSQLPELDALETKDKPETPLIDKTFLKTLTK